MLIANEKELKILAYHPTDIARGVRLSRQDEEVGNGYCLPDPTEQSNGILLCCGGNYSNNRSDNMLDNSASLVQQRSGISQSLSIVNSVNEIAPSQSACDQAPIQMINPDDLDAD